MSERPPVRLFEDDGAPSVLRAALRGARADVPDAAHASAIGASLAKALADLPPPGGGPGGSSGSGGSSAPGGSGAAPAGTSGAGASGASSGSALASGKIAAIGGLATAVAIGAAVVASRATTSPIPVADAPREHAVDAGVVLGAAPSSSTPPDAAAEPVVDVHALPSARPSPLPRGDASRGQPAATTSPAESETAMLKAAQDALATSPADALARCEAHARAYPSGLLAEEREVLAIDALLRLGRRSEAEARAARFRAAHPRSALLRRIDTLLGTSP